MTNVIADKVTALPDHLTEEISRLQPRLRDELTVTFDDTRSEISVVVEDPVNGGFFRLGYSEYAFASMLNGQRSIADVVAVSADTLLTGAFSETQAAALTKWLIDNNLASTSASTDAGRVIDRQRTRKINSTLGRLNPISTQIVLGNPTKLVRLAEMLCGWLFTWSGVLVWFISCVIGVTQVIGHSERIQQSLQPVLASSNLLMMFATWLVLRLAHEGGHAVAARRWGAEVHEAGVAFILFVPLPFVNLTSSWKLNSKWQRIAVAAAGMYVELFLAAIAGCIWSTTVDPLVRQYAMNVVISAGLTTLLFNLNPLMKFDGYYMLSDFLDLPNLSMYAQQWQQQNVDRLLTGKKSEPQTLPPCKRLLVSTYALAAAVWKIIICVSLATAASVLFAGAGLALSCIAIGLWCVMPMVATGRRIRKHCQRYRLGWIRPTLTISSIALGLCATWHTPWKPQYVSPVIMAHDELKTVRAKANGFIEQIHTTQHATVRQGQLLVTLVNPELNLKLAEVEATLTRSQLRQRAFSSQGAIAAAQSELETERTLEKQICEIRDQLDSLLIVAPCNGIVLKSRFLDLQGQYVTAGADICQIGGEQTIFAFVSQTEAKKFDLEGEFQPQLLAQFPGAGQGIECGVTAIAPTATRQIEHAAITSLCSGPIAVQQRSSNQDDWRFLEPQVKLTLHVHAGGLQLQSGRTGVLRYSGERRKVGDLLINRIQNELSKLQRWRRQLID